ncbi:hypothetical protein GMOD_00004132 [Pyrenophora seminiperda CCB06]|uniref:Uncharacterized protein n=1 Tax=Pyrenophora seminiperda CCB06 TaxID=1302712 RepID=A0A3M7M0S8_9PLEO|nr:hypothetical protein GMOD_00004132 [Pyrenophora seminiperda CCB06]
MASSSRNLRWRRPTRRPCDPLCSHKLAADEIDSRLSAIPIPAVRPDACLSPYAASILNANALASSRQRYRSHGLPTPNTISLPLSSSSQKLLLLLSHVKAARVPLWPSAVQDGPSHVEVIPRRSCSFMP